MVDKLARITGWLGKFVDNHPKITQVALDFLAVGSGLSLAVGGLKMAYGAVKYGLGTFVQIGGALMKLPATIGAIADATKIWTGVQWLLDAATWALDAAGIGEILIAVAALAAGGYELYKHWDAVEKVFHRLAADVKALPAWFGNKATAVEHWVGGEASRVEHLFRRDTAGAAGRGGTIHISPTINIHVHGSAPGAFDAKAHAKKVIDIVNDHYHYSCNLLEFLNR